MSFIPAVSKCSITVPALAMLSGKDFASSKARTLPATEAATSQMRHNGDLFISSEKISRFLCGRFWRTVDLPAAKVLRQALHRYRRDPDLVVPKDW